jgi:recombination protein RecT
MTDVKNGATVPPQKEETKLVVATPSHSERFTQEVIKQFTNTAGQLELTSFQKKLCQNYFIKLDQTLKANEIKRLATKEAYRDKLEFIWKNVNMQKLAVDVVSFSSVGLDPIQPNHINLIPYKNNKTSQFDIAFITGYRGKEVKARKYGLEVPDEVVVELIHANDTFKVLKRDVNTPHDTYVFEVNNPLDRGAILGGFYYLSYTSNPKKNRIKVLTMADIEKRKPDSASPEFWGGEKDEWKDGKKTGNKIKVEGWFDEMALKTIYSAAWGSITIDASKIDDHYRSVLEREREVSDVKVLGEIKANANIGETLSIEQEEQPLSIVQDTEENQQNTVDGNAEVIEEQNGPSF